MRGGLGIARLVLVGFLTATVALYPGFGGGEHELKLTMDDALPALVQIGTHGSMS